jgi:hypothetical protein
MRDDLVEFIHAGTGEGVRKKMKKLLAQRAKFEIVRPRCRTWQSLRV